MAIASFRGERQCRESRRFSFRAACHGKQSGWSFEVRLPLPNGTAVSQVYHITIVHGRAYAFVFTHRVGTLLSRLWPMQFDRFARNS